MLAGRPFASRLTARRRSSCPGASPRAHAAQDRLALGVIEDAEAKGLLIKPGDTVVEATSGNTGIAVAMLCAQRGYKCIITMAEPFSVERRKIMRMLGAKVIVTPKAGKGTGMVAKAAELCEKHGWFLCHQFETEANWKFHEVRSRSSSSRVCCVAGTATSAVAAASRVAFSSPLFVRRRRADERVRGLASARSPRNDGGAAGDHGSGDPGRLQGQAARLLGDGLRHGRHVPRRRQGNQGRAP